MYIDIVKAPALRRGSLLRGFLLWHNVKIMLEECRSVYADGDLVRLLSGVWLKERLPLRSGSARVYLNLLPLGFEHTSGAKISAAASGSWNVISDFPSNQTSAMSSTEIQRWAGLRELLPDFLRRHPALLGHIKADSQQARHRSREIQSRRACGSQRIFHSAPVVLVWPTERV